jgi:hypothetical protein
MTTQIKIGTAKQTSGREADQSHLFTKNVTNEWSRTSTPHTPTSCALTIRKINYTAWALTRRNCMSFAALFWGGVFPKFGGGPGGGVMPSTSNDILLTNESGPFPRNYLNCHFQSGVSKPRPEVTFVITATEEKRSTLRKSLSHYHLVHQYYSKYYQSITWDIFNICTY